jgi:hypothetical protein
MVVSDSKLTGPMMASYFFKMSSAAGSAANAGVASASATDKMVFFMALLLMRFSKHRRG